MKTSRGSMPPAAPILALLLALSGAAALGYELVWMRQLSRAFGVTVHAISALLALYMGGLALGGAAASRWRPRRPLLAYAGLEAGAALFALLATELLRRLPELVAGREGEEPLGTLTRLALAAPAILPPTILLGAGLPLLTRVWAEKAGGEQAPAGARTTASGAGVLYAANTAGAVLGLLAAAFWTVGAWGETCTVRAAASLNGAAALGALLLASRRSQRTAAPPARAGGALRVELLYACSGFCALGCELLWSRQLIPLLGNSTYAFSIVLAVILAGIALGSALESRLGKENEPLPLFGALQLGLSAGILISLFGFRAFGAAFDSAEFLYSPLRGPGDLLRLSIAAAVVLGPAALVMGLLFPVAVRAALGPRASPSADGAAVGRLYAANTLGGIAGSLAAGLWAAQALGVHNSLLAFAGLSAGLGLAVLHGSGRLDRRALLAAGALAALGFVNRRDASLDILTARLVRGGVKDIELLFHDDLAAATITGTRTSGASTLYINGVETAGGGMPGTVMAALPRALAERPGATLVVCFGAGNTFRTASRLAGRDEVHAVELVDGLAERMRFFYPDAESHLRAPGRRIFVEDGRQLLLRTPRRYGVIIVDAAPPLFSSGAVNLYTAEFLRLTRRRLAEGGLFVLWLPLPAFADDYWTILRSVTATYPHVAAWAHPGIGSGVYFLGSETPLAWPAGELDRRLKSRGVLSVLPGLNERTLRAALLPVDAGMRRFLADAPPLVDDRPETEFPLRRWLAGKRFEQDLGFLHAAFKSAR